MVLLEGLPGAGKTEVLSVFAARTLPRKALIHFTAASPYHVNKGFGGWSMVLQQYLDSLYKQEVGFCLRGGGGKACVFLVVDTFGGSSTLSGSM